MAVLKALSDKFHIFVNSELESVHYPFSFKFFLVPDVMSDFFVEI